MYIPVRVFDDNKCVHILLPLCNDVQGPHTYWLSRVVKHMTVRIATQLKRKRSCETRRGPSKGPKCLEADWPHTVDFLQSRLTKCITPMPLGIGYNAFNWIRAFFGIRSQAVVVLNSEESAQ